ncbi:LOW QUALITY PROTEIN: uncharacterized protein EMH_0063530 [Eimeria mitis]|uniref:GDT1 family protein n=1 Tax=Eimeria mitis TaxID=44415 RepID=U6KDL4_9EIME|nr:LOW QUALITY PROTEIN: uncharacterized protein EMH_0063530 [Eimeria mitis]CDJ36125.1 transmembrane protein, putative [Eimeria mitis]
MSVGCSRRFSPPQGSRLLQLVLQLPLLSLVYLSLWEGGPLGAPTRVSAHIHVAPEYFHSCDSVPSSAVMLTGGAWLLRSLGAASPLCRGPMGALLGCAVYTDVPHAPSINPRKLQALHDASQPPPESELPPFLLQRLFGWGAPVEHTEERHKAADAGDAAEAAATKHPRGSQGPRTAKARRVPRQSSGEGQHAGVGASPLSPTEQQQQKQQQQKQQQQQQQQPQQEQREESGFWQFIHSVFSSASLVAATELGDRTFFLAALLALRYNRLLVFGATCAASSWRRCWLFATTGCWCLGLHALLYL